MISDTTATIENTLKQGTKVCDIYILLIDTIIDFGFFYLYKKMVVIQCRIVVYLTFKTCLSESHRSIVQDLIRSSRHA